LGRYENEDLIRAKELVDLHYEFKARHALGTVDEELVALSPSCAVVWGILSLTVTSARASWWSCGWILVELVF
jgi:hypothetical protein